MVKRNPAWLGQFQRLPVRHERRRDMHEAFLAVGSSHICFRAVDQFCSKPSVLTKRSFTFGALYRLMEKPERNR